MKSLESSESPKSAQTRVRWLASLAALPVLFLCLSLPADISNGQEADEDRVVQDEEISDTEIDALLLELEHALAKSTDVRPLQTRIKQLESQLQSVQHQLRSVEQKNTEIAGLVSDQVRLIESLKKQNQELVKLVTDARVNADGEATLRQEILGIKGKLDHVVFVVDISGSMKTSGRWEHSQKIINNWLKHLPVKHAGLILFNHEIHEFPGPGMYLPLSSAAPEIAAANRAKLEDFLKNQKIIEDGLTDTPLALSAAYRYPNIDTIILFTDGRPQAWKRGPDGKVKSFPRKDEQGNPLVDENGKQRFGGELDEEEVVRQKVLEIVRQHADDVVVNTVGIGNYYEVGDSKNPTFELLNEISRMTDGSFRGR